jgi:hypothetical protein
MWLLSTSRRRARSAWRQLPAYQRGVVIGKEALVTEESHEQERIASDEKEIKGQ